MIKLAYFFAILMLLGACGNKNNGTVAAANTTVAPASLAHLSGMYTVDDDESIEGSIELEVQIIDNNKLKFVFSFRSIDYSSGEPDAQPDYDTDSFEGTVAIENNTAVWNGDESHKCKLSFTIVDKSIKIIGISNCVSFITAPETIVMSKAK